MLVITFDGPAASGKSSIARVVAKKLGWNFVSTGNMYRASTYLMLRRGINLKDTHEVLDFIPMLTFETPIIDGEIKIYDQGEELTHELLNSQDININVSGVAQISELRKHLVSAQRRLLDLGNLVAEGRDMGSVVFTDAMLKFYIDANAEVRALRRSAQGQVDEILKRDEMDKQRKHSPLVIPEGAVVIDNSNGTLEQGVEKILKICQQYLL
jgi:cytidylate kinase